MHSIVHIVNTYKTKNLTVSKCDLEHLKRSFNKVSFLSFGQSSRRTFSQICLAFWIVSKNGHFFCLRLSLSPCFSFLNSFQLGFSVGLLSVKIIKYLLQTK